MNVKFQNGGEEVTVNLPYGSTAGEVRKSAYSEQREDVGAPSSYSVTVNGLAVENGHILKEGDSIGFRPVIGKKGGL